MQVFLAENPIVRVSSSFSIEKTVVDPNGVVDPAAQYSGTYCCQYGTDAPVTGTWTTGRGRDVHRARHPAHLGVHGHREHP